MQNGSQSFHLALRATHPGGSYRKKEDREKLSERGDIAAGESLGGAPTSGSVPPGALMAVDGATCAYGSAMVRFQMSVSFIVDYGG
jgi:hypothetical protein